MVTNYEAEIDHWQAWQQEYRYGVVLIFPPDPPRGQVNALRAKYDPWSQSTCDAHISLTSPFPRPVINAHWDELKAIASSFEPFTIRYGPLKNSLPHHPGVTLAIEPQAELDRLRVALEMAAAFAGAPDRRYPFSAHMTIAEFISVEQTVVLMDELAGVAPEGDFVCTVISYAVPDTNFHFTERKRLALGHSHDCRKQEMSGTLS